MNWFKHDVYFSYADDIVGRLREKTNTAKGLKEINLE
jgi:hypothetical protein